MIGILSSIPAVQHYLPHVENPFTLPDNIEDETSLSSESRIFTPSISTSSPSLPSSSSFPSFSPLPFDILITSQIMTSLAHLESKNSTLDPILLYTAIHHISAATLALIHQNQAKRDLLIFCTLIIIIICSPLPNHFLNLNTTFFFSIWS